jgi:hypothetical protein
MSQDLYSSLLLNLHSSPVVTVITHDDSNHIVEFLASVVEKQNGRNVMAVKPTSISAMLSYHNIKDKHNNDAVGFIINEKTKTSDNNKIIFTTSESVAENDDIVAATDILVVDVVRDTKIDLLLYIWKHKYDNGFVVPRLVIITPIASNINIGKSITTDNSPKDITYIDQDRNQSLSSTISSYHRIKSDSDPRPSSIKTDDTWIVFLANVSEISRMYEKLKCLDNVEFVRMYTNDITDNASLSRPTNKRRIILTLSSTSGLHADVVFDSMMMMHNGVTVMSTVEESIMRATSAPIVIRDCSERRYNSRIISSRGGDVSLEDISSVMLRLASSGIPVTDFFKNIGTDMNKVKDVRSILTNLNIISGVKLTNRGRFVMSMPLLPHCAVILYNWLEAKTSKSIHSLYSVCAMLITMNVPFKRYPTDIVTNLDIFLSVIKDVGNTKLCDKRRLVDKICKNKDINKRNILCASDRINQCVQSVLSLRSSESDNFKQEVEMDTHKIFKSFKTIILKTMGDTHGYVKGDVNTHRGLYVSKHNGTQIKFNGEDEFVIITKTKMMTNMRKSIIECAELWVPN